MSDPRPAVERMAADLVEASERHARNNPQPEREPAEPWLIIHHVTTQEKP